MCLFDTMDEIGERMSELQCPLLNLHGDADKLTTLEGSQLLQDKAGSKDKTLKVHKLTRIVYFRAVYASDKILLLAHDQKT